MVAIPYKSGKYSYKIIKMFYRQNINFVAIPYKSGKYSYPIAVWDRAKDERGFVAIPYKSGKYSYILYKSYKELLLKKECRNPL